MTQEASQTFRQAAYAQETEQVPIALLTFTSPELVAPVYVASDPYDLLPEANVKGVVSGGIAKCAAEHRHAARLSSGKNVSSRTHTSCGKSHNAMRARLRVRERTRFVSGRERKRHATSARTHEPSSRFPRIAAVLTARVRQAAGGPAVGVSVSTKASQALMAHISSCIAIRPSSLSVYTAVPSKAGT
jgi:hypothetical protein